MSEDLVGMRNMVLSTLMILLLADKIEARGNPIQKEMLTLRKLKIIVT